MIDMMSNLNEKYIEKKKNEQEEEMKLIDKKSSYKCIFFLPLFFPHYMQLFHLFNAKKKKKKERKIHCHS